MANNSNSVQPSDEEGSHSRNVISNDQTTSHPLSTSAPSQQPPPRPVRRKPDGNRATPPVQNRFHQPHGAAATGPTPAVVSSSGHSYLHGHLGFPSYQQQPPGQPHVLSMESPLPPVVQRGLGDRSNDKRKNAALEIEALIKSLQEANNIGMIRSVITVLSNDFCTSMNSNYRKGGLIGLAATAIGLHQNARNFLNALLPPVLHCFDDPEARVRYYACESVYNIAKVSRQFILTHFNQIFEGLAKLFADVDVDVKNGANLLDKLVKDIVTETETFHVEQFLPLLQNYIRRTNPYIRQLLVGWITVLDTIPDISMIDYLPEFLDGLFNMLSDSNREIRQAADSALSDFLREVTVSAVVEFGPIISILVVQCRSKERLNRLTAETWLSELIHHPYSGGDALLPIQAEILGAVLWCISDEENEIRLVAERTNDDCMTMVRETSSDFELKPLLDTLTNELLHKDDVPTKLAALGWINMLMEKRKADMNDFTEDLLPVLLRTLSDPSDAVILLDLQVLSRISLAQQDELGYAEETEEIQFQMVLNAILNLFAKDRRLLETRGSLIIRKLCVLLNAKSVYIRMADTMASYEMKDDGEVADIETLQFVSTMVQTLNLILLTASELQDLRTTLATAFTESSGARSNVFKEVDDDDDDDGGHVFATLFHCWAHNPIATFSLCLLARTYDLSFCLIKRFSDMPDVSVGFLMQIDKLVHLLESPIFLQLRLQLLDVESPCHAPLLKSIYGLLMCLPQGNAFRLLNERLATVCNLRDNLGVQEASTGDGSPDNLPSIVSRTGLSMEKLLERFDNVDEQHHKAKNRSQGSVEREKDVEAGTGASGTHPAVVEDSAQLGHIKPPSIADAFGVSREDEERTQHPLTRVSSDAKDSPDRPNMQQPIS